MQSLRTSGVALLSTLVILGVASTFIAHILTGQTTALQRHRSNTLYQQLLLYQFSVENLVARVLREDEDFAEDNCDEVWAKPLPPYPLDGGVIAVTIYDSNSALNINQLHNLDFTQDNHQKKARPHSKERLTFIALQQMLKEKGFLDATASLLAVVDWLDANDSVSFFEDAAGFENNHYLSLEHPHRAANRQIYDARELLNVHKMHDITLEGTGTHDTVYNFFTKRRPYGCDPARSVPSFSTLPVASAQPTAGSDRAAALNVNTASCATIARLIHAFRPEELYDFIFKVVSEKLCPAEKRSAASSTEVKTFKSVDSFFDTLDSSALASTQGISWKKQIPADLFTTQSHYFGVDVTFNFGDCVMQTASILHRAQKVVTVQNRQIESFVCQ